MRRFHRYVCPTVRSASQTMRFLLSSSSRLYCAARPVGHAPHALGRAGSRTSARARGIDRCAAYRRRCGDEGSVVCTRPASRQTHSHAHGEPSRTPPHLRKLYLRQCQLVTVVGGITNVFFSVTKLWSGSVGGSVALVADGFHAFTDILTDIISYTSLTLSRKKLPRCDFPFGMGRLETAGAVVVAAVLFFGGVALLIQSVQHGIRDLRHTIAHAARADASPAAAGHPAEHADPHGGGEEAESHMSSAHAPGHSHAFAIFRYDTARGREVVMWSMLLLAASSVVCKEALFHWTRRVGLRARSRVTVANAYHHRADAWSGAVALVGVSAQYWGIPGVDGLAGVVVSLSICKMGYGVFRDSVLEFFDYQDAGEVAQVRAQLQKFHLHRGAEEGGVRWCSATHQRPATLTHGEEESAGGGHTGSGARGMDEDSRGGECTSTSDRRGAMDMPPLLGTTMHDTIRFVNVLLTRHGTAYTMYVTLLVPANLCAREIVAATDKITELAQRCIEVKYAYTVLLACSEQTVTRAAYQQSRHMVASRALASRAADAAVAAGEGQTHATGNGETTTECHHRHHGHDKSAGEHAEEDEYEAVSWDEFEKACAQHGHSHSHDHGHSHMHAHSARRGDCTERTGREIAAHGDVVNPSLERCIRAVMRDHSFVHPIRYCWERRTIMAPATETQECRVDVQAIADMFNCQLQVYDAKKMHEDAE